MTSPPCLAVTRRALPSLDSTRPASPTAPSNTWTHRAERDLDKPSKASHDEHCPAEP